MKAGTTSGLRRHLGELESALVLAGVLLAGVSAGQAPQGDQQAAQAEPRKPAWQWTLEERLAARFDPEGMKTRAAREAEEGKKAAAKFGERFEVSPDQHTLQGRLEPELFTPGELFNVLLSDAFHDNALHQKEMRSAIEERAAVLGLGSDLWQRLEKVAAPYLRLRDERNLRALSSASRSESFEEPEAESRARCRARTNALADAKSEFGEEAFLRLLYEALAPTMSITYSATEMSADRLRASEGGCR